MVTMTYGIQKLSFLNQLQWKIKYAQVMEGPWNKAGMNPHHAN